MLRVRIDGGQLTQLEQLRVIAAISTDVRRATPPTSPTGRTSSCTGSASRTCRRSGGASRPSASSTTEACGDVPRVILGSPVAGIAADELIDPTPRDRRDHRAATSATPESCEPAAQVQVRHQRAPEPGRRPRGQRHRLRRRGAPRATGPASTCGSAAACRPTRSLGRAPGRVGAARPGRRRSGRGVAQIFRDYGYRRLRNKARLKFLLADWGAEKFREVLRGRVPRPRRCVDGPPPPEAPRRPATTSACTSRRTAGSTSASAPSSAGSPGPSLAKLGRRRRGARLGRLRTTPHQKLVVLDVDGGQASSRWSPALDAHRAAGRARACSAAARWPAPASSSASSPSSRPRQPATAAVAELEERLDGFRAADIRSRSTSTAAPTRAPASRSPTSASRASSSRATASRRWATRCTWAAASASPGPRRPASAARVRGLKRAAADGLADYVERLSRAAPRGTATPATRPSPSGPHRARGGGPAVTVPPRACAPPSVPRDEPQGRSPSRATWSSAASPTSEASAAEGWSPGRRATSDGCRRGRLLDGGRRAPPPRRPSAAPGVDVLFLDTGYHFTETVRTRDEVRRALAVRIVGSARPTQTVAEQDAEFGAEPRSPATLARAAPAARSARCKDALGGYEAWVTGVRREEAPTRPNTPLVGVGRAQRTASRSTRSRRGPRRRCSTYAAAHKAPVNLLVANGYPSIGCEPCTQAGSPPARTPAVGRWAGLSKTECGLHDDPLGRLRALTPSPFPPRPRATAAATTARPRPPRGRGHPRHPRGGRPSSSGPVLLFSGGKDSIVMLHLATQGVRAGARAVPGAARRHRAQLPRGPRLPRRDRRAARPAPRGRPRARTTSTTAGCGSAPTALATRCRPLRCSTPSREAASTRCSAAAAATRRGPAPRSGSSRCATSSASGTRATSAPSCGACYNGSHRPGEHVRVVPALQLDRARRLELHRRARAPTCRRSTTPTSATCTQRDGMRLRRRARTRRRARARASSAGPSATGPSAT